MGKQRVFLDLKSGSCKRPGMRVVVVQNLGGKTTTTAVVHYARW